SDCPRTKDAQSRTHLEVLGVHMQLVAVQLAQLGEGLLDVVQVLHGLPEGGQNLLAVFMDLLVVEDGAGAGEVPEGGEKPLGPGVDDQQPRERETGAETRMGLAQPPHLPWAGRGAQGGLAHVGLGVCFHLHPAPGPGLGSPETQRP
uniref:Uncharacterized protein n=1 Tax=Chelydra serpentina TaxID=8475 RepID=A0A8C3XUF9_CHESE